MFKSSRTDAKFIFHPELPSEAPSYMFDWVLNTRSVTVDDKMMNSLYC